MQTVLLVVGSVAIAVVAIAFTALALGVLREARKIGQASEDLSHFLRSAEEELASTTREARSTLSNIDQLAVKSTETVERVSNVAAGAERLVDGAYLATAVAKAAKSSTAGLASVYEGVKQGIRTLCGSQETNEGGTSDEQ